LSTTGFDAVVTGLTGASLTGGLFETTGGADTNTGDTTGSSADVDFTKAGGALAISRGLASDFSLGVGAAMTAKLSAFPTVDGVAGSKGASIGWVARAGGTLAGALTISAEFAALSTTAIVGTDFSTIGSGAGALVGASGSGGKNGFSSRGIAFAGSIICDDAAVSPGACCPSFLASPVATTGGGVKSAGDCGIIFDST
jgi:hypothetical protein